MCVEEVILGDGVKELFSGSTARFDIATARGESSTERNYRWARRAFSSGGHLPPPPLRGSWAAVIEPLHGKAFCLMGVKKGKERERERLNTLVWTCSFLSLPIMVPLQQKYSECLSEVMGALILYMTENSLLALIYCYTFSTAQHERSQHSLFVPFSWHSQLTLGFRLGCWYRCM